MFKWLKNLFRFEPATVIDGNDWPGFVVGGWDHVKIKRSTIPGKTPAYLRDREIAYNINDDVFFVGKGNNEMAIYVRKT